LSKASSTKLFRQWTKEAALPPSAIPHDLQEKPAKAKAAPTHDEPEFEDNLQSRPANKGMIQLPLRYIFVMLAIIAVLLVALTVLITVQLS
jgi:hypothetical protein